MNDLISRQAALDIFDDYNVAVESGQIEAYSRDRKRLCDLPPAQPEQRTGALKAEIKRMNNAESDYQRGLEEGKARNEDGCIGCRYDDGTTEHSPCGYCCNAYSNQWMAKEKTDKIVVGDEVKDRTDDCGVVTWSYGNDAYVLWRDGSTGNYAADELIKTGRHFNFLASLLNAMKEGAE